MLDIVEPQLYKKISSDNYLLNCYKYLVRSKSIHFIFILIEMILNIFQELEIQMKGFNSEISFDKKYFISIITFQFEKIPLIIRIIIIVLILIFSYTFYFILTIKRFISNYVCISIILNILEIVYFRAIMIIFLNIYLTLPNLYYLVGLVFLIPHIYLIAHNFLYNHLYYFVPNFIDFPYDEFTSLFDIILLFSKLILSVTCNTNNISIKKFFFIILFACQVFFTFYFIYKLIFHSYLFMKNTFLNKTKVSLFCSNTIIIIIAILFGKDEIFTVLFLILFIGIFLIIMAYMYLIYNPFHYIRINRDTKMENIFFYLFVLSEKNELEFLIENKINEHYEKCGLCNLCKKYNQYLENHEINEEEDEEKEKLVNINNNDNENKLFDLFDIIYDGNNKYFELIKKISLNYKNKGKESFNNNSYYYINISFLMYSDYQNNNITLSLNEKILLDAFNKENKLLDNHKSQIKQILFCNNFINLGNKTLNQLKDILKCEQKINKAKKLIDLSVLLKEMQNPKYKNNLFSHKQDNISNCKNLIMACSIIYEEIFNTTINNTQLPLRENIQPLEDIFKYNSTKVDKIISLSVNLTNNNCKIIRAGKDLSSYKNNNFFDLFPLIFKEYQINLFLSKIMENFDISIYNKNKDNNIDYKDTKKLLKEGKKTIKPLKISSNNNKNKREYVEIKVIICENNSSKIYYRLLTLKLSPLFNDDINNYFILFDGIFFLHKNTIISLKDFEEGNNPKEKILAVSEPELEKNQDIYSMQFNKYVAYQNTEGFNVPLILKFNLSTKLYSIYSIIPRERDTKIKNIKRISGSVRNSKNEDDFEEDDSNIKNKKLIHKNSKFERMIEDTASVASQQAGSSYTNGISGIGIRNKKKDNIHEYNSLSKIRKIIYFSIPFILIILIIEFIYLKNLEKDIFHNNISYFQFREFYSLYFQLFTSILGIACIKTDPNKCKNLVSSYSEEYNNRYDFEENDYFDFTLFIREQTQNLASLIMDKRNNLVNIHKNIGNQKYNELFSQNVDYYRISQSYIKGKIIFSLIQIKMEFTEAILIICNSFQIMTNNTSEDPIIFLNKMNDPFVFLNNLENDGNELTQYQKEIFEMILNYKIYREKFNNINEKLFDILISKNKYLKVIVYLFLIMDTFFMLFISFLLYAYLMYFENILMKILNYINMTINTKNDKFSFLEKFSKKIEYLETILSIYNDPVNSVQELNSMYNGCQLILSNQNKNNANELNKKGIRKMSRIDNKKTDSEMANIPKNQRIVTKRDIRNMHIIYNYLLYFSLILASFLTTFVGLMILWSRYFKKGNFLYNLFKKNYILESSVYKSINIYDLMIFNNFTINELSEIIFNDSNINKNEPNSLIKSFYEDLQYAFNSIKEKNELNTIYYDFEKKQNFTCEMLYEVSDLKIKELNDSPEINQLNNTKKNLIKFCNKSRIDESNGI